jgi:hypothetical protein
MNLFNITKWRCIIVNQFEEIHAEETEDAENNSFRASANPIAIGSAISA